MNRRHLAVLSCTALLLAGCGKSLCERADAFWAGNPEGTCDLVSVIPVSLATCQATESVCQGDDEKKASSVMDCLEGLSACEQGQEQAFLNALAACEAKGAGLSTACGDTVLHASLCARTEALLGELAQSECHLSISGFARASCDAFATSCTVLDVPKQESALACIDALGACTKQTRSDFLSQVSQCQALAEGLSTSCATAFDVSITRQPIHVALASVTTDGQATTFTYSGQHLLLASNPSANTQAAVTYTGDDITGATRSENGSLVNSLSMTYSDGRVHTMSVTSVSTSGTSTFTYTITYDSAGRPTRLDGTSSGVSFLEDLTYDGDHLAGVTLTVSVAGYTSVSTSTYAYDAGGLLSSMTNTSTTTTTTTFRYDSQNRLQQVVYGTAGTYALTYNADGLISAIAYTTSSGTSTTTYAYKDFDAQGLVATPAVSGGELFDMGGNLLPSMQLLTYSSVAGL